MVNTRTSCVNNNTLCFAYTLLCMFLTTNSHCFSKQHQWLNLCFHCRQKILYVIILTGVIKVNVTLLQILTLNYPQQTTLFLQRVYLEQTG